MTRANVANSGPESMEAKCLLMRGLETSSRSPFRAMVSFSTAEFAGNMSRATATWRSRRRGAPALPRHPGRMAPAASPLRRSDPHVALERALECGFRLIPDSLRDGAGGRRFFQFIRRERHPDVGQEIAGRAPELLLELARKRCPRHVAQARKVGQRPCARRFVEQRSHRRPKARMAGQGKGPRGAPSVSLASRSTSANIAVDSAFSIARLPR